MSIFSTNVVAAEPATYLPPVRQLLTLEQVKKRLERDLPLDAPLSEEELNERYHLTAGPDHLQNITEFAKLSTRKQPLPDDTHRKYLENFRDRKARGLLDPLCTTDGEPPTRNGYYYNRAALSYAAGFYIQEWLERYSKGALAGNDSEILKEIQRWAELVDFVMVHAKPGQRIDQPNSKSKFISESSRKSIEPDKEFRKGTSKRNGMHKLPQLWRRMMAAHIKSSHRYADHLTILEMTGARPVEFSNGIRVRRVRGALEFTLQGGKLSDTTGVKERVLTVPVRTQTARRLARKLIVDGPAQVWQCKEKALADYVTAVRKKAFPGHAYKVSPYSYRHALASDVKSAGAGRGDIAAALGHRSTRTAGAYGRKGTSGKLRPNPIKAVRVTGEIRTTHSIKPDFSSLRSLPAKRNRAPKP
jgi:hypothetical protein